MSSSRQYPVTAHDVAPATPPVSRAGECANAGQVATGPREAGNSGGTKADRITDSNRFRLRSPQDVEMAGPETGTANRLRDAWRADPGRRVNFPVMSVNRALTRAASGMGDLVSSSNITGTKPVRITDPTRLPGLFRARCCVQASVREAIWVPKAGGTARSVSTSPRRQSFCFTMAQQTSANAGMLSLVGPGNRDRGYWFLANSVGVSGDPATLPFLR